MKVNLLQGDFHPHTHAYAGRTQADEADGRPLRPQLTGQPFSLRFAQGERGAERLVPALRSATGEPGTRDGSPFGGPLSAALLRHEVAGLYY